MTISPTKVTCEELKILWGKDYYMENILGLQFKVSAFFVFQTNVAGSRTTLQ